MVDDMRYMRIEMACRKLVLRTVQYIDTGNTVGLVQLFAADGILVRPDGRLLKGHSAIQAAYAQRPADRLTRHLVTNTLVEVESSSCASALSYVLLWTGSRADPDSPQGRQADAPQRIGEFEDQFILTREGWRLQRRDARFVLHCGETVQSMVSSAIAS